MKDFEIRPDASFDDLDRILSVGFSVASATPNQLRVLHHMERYWFASSLMNGPVTVLDVGSACGLGVRELFRRHKEISSVVGVEIEQDISKDIEKQYPQYHVVNCDILQFETSEKFDFVLCFELIGFDSVSSDTLLLNKLLSLCKPEGRVLLSAPNYGDRTKKKYFLRTYNVEQLTNFVSTNTNCEAKVFGQAYPLNRSESDPAVRPINDCMSNDFTIVALENV